jgi:hypothetical protein
MAKGMPASNLTKGAALAGVALLVGAYCNGRNKTGTEAPSSIEGSRSALGVSPGAWTQISTTFRNGAYLLPREPAPGEQLDLVRTSSGAAHTVVTHPTNANIVYIASVSGGIWKTENARSSSPSWRPLTDSLPWLWSPTLVMDPAQPETLVSGVGIFTSGSFMDLAFPSETFALIYVTRNGGDHWEVLNDLNFPDLAPYEKAHISALNVHADADPGNPERVVLAGTFQHGLWRGHTNGGFVRVTDNLPPSSNGSATGFGYVFALAPVPGNPNTIYAAIGPTSGPCSSESCAKTEGGIYMTTDGGTVWSNISNSNDRLKKALSACPPEVGHCLVTNVLLSASGSGRLYAGVVLFDSNSTDLSYLGRTDNQGATWAEMDLPRAPILQYEPWDPSVICYRGNITAIQPSGPVPGQGPLPALEITTDAPHELFKSGGYGKRTVLIKGVTAPGMADVNRDWFIKPTANNDPNKFLVYDLATRAGTASGPSCNASTPCQGTWQSWGGVGVQTEAMLADPDYGNLLYLAGTGSVPHLAPPGAGSYSEQGPDTFLARGDAAAAAASDVPSPAWTFMVGTATDSYTSPFTDPRGFAFDALGSLYEVSDGGVVRHTNPRGLSLDGGAGVLGDWINMNGDLSTIQIRDLAIDTRSGLAFGGCQDSGTISQPPSGLEWTDWTGGDGNEVEVEDRFPEASYRYHGYKCIPFNADGVPDPFPPSCDFSLTIKAPKDGNTTPEQLGGDAKPFMINKSDDALDRDHSHIVFGWSGTVYESLNGGREVTSLGPIPGQTIALAYGHPACNGYKDALWVIQHDVSPSTYVRLSADATLHAIPHQPPASTHTADIALSPQSCRTAYIVASEQVFMTTDAEETDWTDITGDLARLKAGPLHSIQYVPSATGDRLFVAGSVGVYMSSPVTNPKVWVRVGTGLPNALPRDLDYDPIRHKLVVATFGRGVFALSNPELINQAPIASCKGVTLPVGPSCVATPTASAFDNGSTDPDGNPLTFTAVDRDSLEEQPLGSLPPGNYQVTIKVADNQGAYALCPDVTLTVTDPTPPVLQVPADQTIRTCASTAAVSIGQATATDDCAAGLVPTGEVISRNGVALPTPIPVTNGQATLGPGTYVVRWTVSDNANPPVQDTQIVTVAPPVQTSRSFILHDRAQLKGPGGSWAALLNAGTGTTKVSQDCKLGGIISQSSVTVQHRSIVYGDVVSGGEINPDTDATITGTQTEHATITLPAPPALPAYPSPILAGFTVNSGQTMTKWPGSYSSQTSINGGTLILKAGDYYFESLTINSGSIVRVTPTTRIFVKTALVFNAPFLASSGSAVQPIYLGYAGTANLYMYAVFNGTLLAPNALVAFGTGSGLTFTGSFYGKAFEVTPDSKLVCSM